MWATARTVRLADGPDEAHIAQLGKRENRRALDVQKSLEKQAKKVDELFAKFGAKDLKACGRREKL
jgi:acyl-CoA dehydrogenase